jgi:hypothetical protein
MDSCKVCGKDIPMHLGDWSTKRHEIECFCGEHIPDINVRVFVGEGWKVGIRALTENAVHYKDMNMPNVEEEYTIEDR